MCLFYQNMLYNLHNVKKMNCFLTPTLIRLHNSHYRNQRVWMKYMSESIFFSFKKRASSKSSTSQFKFDQLRNSLINGKKLIHFRCPLHSPDDAIYNIFHCTSEKRYFLQKFIIVINKFIIQTITKFMSLVWFCLPIEHIFNVQHVQKEGST